MNLYKADIKYLPGMGPKKAEILNKEAQIFSLYDLVQTFPYRYIDRSKFYKISEISSNNTHIQIKGKIIGFSTKGEGRAKRLIAHFTDGFSQIELVFFKGIPFVLKAYQLNTEYIVFGKPNYFNGVYSFVHPDIEVPSDQTMQGFMPLYHTTEKMKNHFLHSKALQKFIYLALKQLPTDLPETLPASVIQKRGLMPLYEALWQIHFPQSMFQLEKARARLRYEELFYIQVAILRQAGLMRSKQKGHPMPVVGDVFHTFYQKYLPFELTGAQKRVIKEIRADIVRDTQMNRLVQGDVGSGKTMVALLSMLMAVGNGFQACLLAPTEILATQHYEGLSALLKDMPVTIKLLTGSTKKKDRVSLHQALQDGSLHILVGTHAVLEDEVRFARLGMAIIDEQHRFGVAQRAKMWAKNQRPPHVLVMTATPIPRTLAMTVYGDLDVSVIDELPPGRKPIQTFHLFENKREKLHNFVRQQLDQGRQIYVVYPLIKESEKSDLKDLEAGFESMQAHFPQVPIGMIHGKMKPAEKDSEMQRFVGGETRILVATTVIEVGVNVPNASVMIIENAERFGLAQLHQLRGRVGRGADQSYCVLMTKYELSSDTRKRLEIMTETNDGFRIAEADMKLRGPGDMDGTMQSGLPFALRIANLTNDGEVLQQARTDVQEILQADPLLAAPQHAVLLTQLKYRATDAVNWSLIS
jgi:ATP-dependent DNA helicase RecG